MGLIPWESKGACDADYFWPKGVIWDSLDYTLFGRPVHFEFYYHTSSTFVLSLFLLRLNECCCYYCWFLDDDVGASKIFPLLLLGHPWEEEATAARCSPKMHVSDAKIRGCFCASARSLKCSPPEDNERRASSASILSLVHIRPIPMCVQLYNECSAKYCRSSTCPTWIFESFWTTMQNMLETQTTPTF